MTTTTATSAEGAEAQPTTSSILAAESSASTEDRAAAFAMMSERGARAGAAGSRMIEAGPIHTAMVAEEGANACTILAEDDKKALEAKKTLGESVWRHATREELNAMMEPSQLDSTVNDTCSFPIKSGCAGNPYHPASCGRADRVHLFHRSTWVMDRDAAHGHRFLFQLLNAVAQRPPCTLTFVGDSLANQLIFAAAAGALHMGWKMKSFCWDGPGNDWKMEKEPSLTHPCDNRLFDMKFQAGPDGNLTLHRDCENLTIGAFMRIAWLEEGKDSGNCKRCTLALHMGAGELGCS